ncbi:MAG TPA: glycosyltransferase family A protein [Miltoncostaeaceae bacterium]|nr:glycosyltransferase family A protein [Miltoncostaeaceae bacterium]
MRTSAPGWPSIAIVVLNHDYAAYLPDALATALDQTRPAHQVIAVDDGSTDDSRALLRGYGDRVEVLLQPNRGQAAAINAGATRARADVVVFLDADDALEPHALERIAEAFAALPDAARVHYPMRVMDGAGRISGETRPPAPARLPRGDQRAAVLATPFDQPWAAMSGNAFSAAVLRRVLPLPEGPRVGADWLLVHTSSLYGPVERVDEPLARYRVHGRNSYALDGSHLDLPALRATIAFAGAGRAHLARHAEEGGRTPAAPPLASFSDAGNRLLSLRLDPAAHPVPGDTRLITTRLGLRALRHRRDLSLPRRLVFAAWLGAAALGPRRFVPTLALWFMHPAARPAPPPGMTRVIRRLRAPAGRSRR